VPRLPAAADTILPMAPAQAQADSSDGGIVIVHSSDLHLGTWGERDDLSVLAAVLGACRQAAADALILAGDIFDTNRLPLAVVDHAARMLAEAGLEVVVLPGNHDPAVPDSVYRKGGLGDPANVHVLGVTCDETVTLAQLDLEVCGRPHLDYVDMAPLLVPQRRTMLRQVVVAHGHFVRADYDEHRSWRFYEDDISATRADYVALGHWELAQRVGSDGVAAYYSGSPDRAGTVNVVRLADGGADVSLLPLQLDRPRRHGH